LRAKRCTVTGGLPPVPSLPPGPCKSRLCVCFLPDPHRCNSLSINDSHFVPADHPRGQNATRSTTADYSRAGLARKLTETSHALRLEGAGTYARRKLAFGKGFPFLHAI